MALLGSWDKVSLAESISWCVFPHVKSTVDGGGGSSGNLTAQNLA